MAAENIRLKTLIACFAAVISVEAGLRFTEAGNLLNLLLNLSLARTLEAVLIIALLLIFEKRISVVGLKPDGLLRGLRRGVLWSAGFGAAAVLLWLILSAAGASPLEYVRHTMPDHALAGYFLTGALIGPVAEELFFRGVIYGFLRRWGVAAAVVMSTVLFTLAHALSGGAGLAQVTGGVVFAIAYEREGSLIVPITIHVLGNTAVFCLSLLF